MADTLQSGGGDPGSGLGLCARRYRTAGDREVYTSVFLILFLPGSNQTFFWGKIKEINLI